MAKVFIRDFTFDMPQWNGEKFLVVSDDDLRAFVAHNVSYNEWRVVGKQQIPALGRYNEIGYGTLPPEGEDWIEVPIISAEAFDGNDETSTAPIWEWKA